MTQSVIQFRSHFNDLPDIRFPLYKGTSIPYVLCHTCNLRQKSQQTSASQGTYVLTICLHVGRIRQIVYTFWKLTPFLCLGDVNPLMQHIEHVKHIGRNMLIDLASVPASVPAVPRNMIHKKHSVFFRDEQMGSGKCG